MPFFPDQFLTYLASPIQTLRDNEMGRDNAEQYRGLAVELHRRI